MKLSRQTREIINIVIFFLVLGILLTFYVIYPLNRTKAALARPETELPDDLADSLGDTVIFANDPGPYLDAGLAVDTFRVESDGLTTLSCLYLAPDSTIPADSIRGTVLLIPPEWTDRTAMIPLASALHDSGFAVVTYDQRAMGGSTGEYHGEGRYEATDLEALLAWLEIRNRLAHPLTVVGAGLGAEAALLAAREEGRIDYVIAWYPYLTTTNWLDDLADRNGWLWFPFRRTVMWFWYELRSGYAAPYRDLDRITEVGCPTLLVAQNIDDSEAIERLREVSPDHMLRTTTSENRNFETGLDTIIGYIVSPNK